ncbi:MAG TPA: aminotransferase class I/II-fold pyridoxal phosphate-dependent enzyme [Chitinophagaceae bacterium]|nr:aminotransferase class I/II-fold pyridoxal phosphate-dependent enzyme [Chitinophagaceae bacterium]
MDLSYILNHLGENHRDYFNAIAPPIMQTSNFAFKDVDGLRKALADEYGNTLYSRGNNPTVDMLRKKLAALDGAEDALVMGSGMAAISTAVMAHVMQGDHIVSITNPYNWTYKLFAELLPCFGIRTTFVDGKAPDCVEKAIRPDTRLIYLESPNTLTYELQDLEAIAALARSRNILTLIDNSYCTPLYQQPIKYGIDMCVQSATKYIGGHSDVIAGVLTGSRTMIKKIFEGEFLNIGTNISPMNAWLLLRGLRTLPVRLQSISETTMQVVGFMAAHPKIEKVYYPFHPSFPQYELAKKQMLGCGGLFTVTIRTTDGEAVERFCNALKYFFLAVSWGGHESLVSPWIAGVAKNEFDPANEMHRQVRFYVGLEDAAFLIEDLRQALDLL